MCLGECIKNMCTQIQWNTNGLLSHKKNETMPFKATWIDLEMIILSEVTQTEKDKYHMISLIYRI